MFVCQSCGSQSRKWAGRCPDCGAWNALVEEPEPASSSSSGGGPGRRTLRRSGRAGGGAPLRRHRRGVHAAARERIRRVRPGAGRRHRPRLGGAGRRRAGHREVDAAAAGRRPGGRVAGPRALRLGRGVRAPGQGTRAASGHGGRPALSARRDLPRKAARRRRARAAGHAGRRFHPDHLLAEARLGARQRRPGPRGGDAPALQRQAPQPAHLPGGTRHEGGQPGRPEGAGARGRHRPLLRGGSGVTRTGWCGPSRTASGR